MKLTDGTVVTTEELYPKGHPNNAMTDAEIEKKFHTLAGPLMDEAKRRYLLDLCWKLDELDNLADLMAATKCNG